MYRISTLVSNKALEMLEIQRRFKEKPEMLNYVGVTVGQIQTDFKCSKQLKSFMSKLNKRSSKIFFEMLKCSKLNSPAYCHMWFNGIIFVAQGCISISPPEKPGKTFEAGSIIGIEKYFKRKPLSFWKVSPEESNTVLYVLERSVLEEALEDKPESTLHIFKLLLNEMTKFLLPLSELQQSSSDSTAPLAPIMFFLEGYNYVDPRNAQNVIKSYYEILPNALSSLDKNRQRLTLGQKTTTTSIVSKEPLQALPVLLSKYEEENVLKKSVEENKEQEKKFKSAFLEANLTKQKTVSEDEEAIKRNTLMQDEYERLQEDNKDLLQEYDELVMELEVARKELEEIKGKEKKEMEIKEQLQTKEHKAKLVKQINSNAAILRAGEFFNKQVRFKTQSKNLANTVFALHYHLD